LCHPISSGSCSVPFATHVKRGMAYSLRQLINDRLEACQGLERRSHRLASGGVLLIVREIVEADTFHDGGFACPENFCFPADNGIIFSLLLLQVDIYV
jgi:hypothetical protein